MQFLVPRVACKLARLTHELRPVPIRVSRSYATSNVVAVLRTSKFRRLCGEYIKAGVPDSGAIAVITEERDRLSKLGLLDERSTELYNEAWNVSQSPPRPPRPVQPVYFPGYTIPPQFSYPPPYPPALPPSPFPPFLDAPENAPPFSQELPYPPLPHQTPLAQSTPYPPDPHLSPPYQSTPHQSTPHQSTSLPNQSTLPQSTPFQAPPSPSQKPTQTPKNQPNPNRPNSLQSNPPAVEFADALQRHRYFKAMYYYRKLISTGATPNFHQFQALINMALLRNDFDACKILVAEINKKFPNRMENTISHNTCLIAAVKAGKEDYVNQFIELMKERQAITPSNLVELVSAAPTQDMAKELLDKMKDYVKPTGTPVNPRDTKLIADLSKLGAAQRPLTKAYLMSLESGEPLSDNMIGALLTDLATHCDVEGCKLIISHTSSPKALFNAMRLVKEQLVDGSCEESVKEQANTILQSPRTTLKIAMIKFTEESDLVQAMKAYEQFLANIEPDTDQATLPIVANLVTAAYLARKPDVATRVLGDFKENNMDIFAACLREALRRGDKTLANDLIEKLGEADKEWLSKVDRDLFLSTFKYGTRTNNISLTSECYKAWQPSETFHLDSTSKSPMRLLYAHLVKTGAIERTVARQFCMRTEIGFQFPAKAQLELLADLARHGDIEGCTLMSQLTPHVKEAMKVTDMQACIEKELIAGSWDASTKAKAQELVAAIQTQAQERQRAREQRRKDSIQTQGNLQTQGKQPRTDRQQGQGQRKYLQTQGNPQTKQPVNQQRNSQTIPGNQQRTTQTNQQRNTQPNQQGNQRRNQQTNQQKNLQTRQGNVSQDRQGNQKENSERKQTPPTSNKQTNTNTQNTAQNQNNQNQIQNSQNQIKNQNPNQDPNAHSEQPNKKTKSQKRKERRKNSLLRRSLQTNQNQNGTLQSPNANLQTNSQSDNLQISQNTTQQTTN